MDLLKPSYATGYAKNASQSAHPNLWDGLVGAWMPSLGVTGETLRDVSGNGNHGTLTNMDAASDWVTTSKGLALDFDGVNDYVDLGVSLFSGSQPATLSMTFVTHDITNDRKIFAQTSNIAGAAKDFTLETGGLRWRHIGGNITYGAGTVLTNQIHSFSFLIPNGSSFTDDAVCYIDGIEYQGVRTAGSNQVLSSSLSNARFGASAIWPGLFDGRILSASFHNRALSPSEIKQLYVDSLAPFRRKQRVSVAVPAATPTPSATYHPLRSLAHPLEQ